jgi:hypothetical protein
VASTIASSFEYPKATSWKDWIRSSTFVLGKGSKIVEKSNKYLINF